MDRKQVSTVVNTLTIVASVHQTWDPTSKIDLCSMGKHTCLLRWRTKNCVIHANHRWTFSWLGGSMERGFRLSATDRILMVLIPLFQLRYLVYPYKMYHFKRLHIMYLLLGG